MCCGCSWICAAAQAWTAVSALANPVGAQVKVGSLCPTYDCISAARLRELGRMRGVRPLRPCALAFFLRRLQSKDGLLPDM